MARSVAWGAALVFCLSGCRTAQLEVQAGSRTLGTVPVTCIPVEPWPGQGALALTVMVEPPHCDTDAGVFVHVFRDDEKLASARWPDPLKPGHDELRSGPFQNPGSGVLLEVEVHARCSGSGERVWGASTCRVP